MGILQVDQEKCTRCGICEAVCPVIFIRMGEEGPREVEGGRCIACGHCVAVCPATALDNELTPLKEQQPINRKLQWDAETAEQFLRTRRSIRTYRKEKAGKGELERLLGIARLAPTASNSQSISFKVISDDDKLRKVWEAVIAWMKQAVQSGGARSSFFKVHIEAFQRGKDTILRGAPHLILALCPEAMGQAGRSNAEFVLAYAELYAPAIGLGTCWGGLVQHCAFSGYEPLLEALGIPEGKVLAGALMAGYPQYRYQRMVNRSPLTIVWE